MCAWLEVSKSGFYEWRGRPVSAAQRRRELLAYKIGALFEAFDGTYGYRRIHAELVRAGERVCPKLVRKPTREFGLIPVQPRPFRTTTEPDPDASGRVDLVKRDFTAQRPGTKVVGDITYIRTWQGWLYLAVLTDRCTREVIGYAMAGTTGGPSSCSTRWQWQCVTDGSRPIALCIPTAARNIRRANTGRNWSSSGCGIRSGGLVNVGTTRSLNRFSQA